MRGAPSPTTASCAWWSTRPAGTTRRTRSSAARSTPSAPSSTSSSSATSRASARCCRQGVQYVSVVHAPDVIGYNEEPATAARAKTGSSIVIGLKLVHAGEADAFVSAGNTGAVVAASVLYVRRIPGVKRPAICTIMPAMPAPVAFLDVGANAEVRAEFLRQFADHGPGVRARGHEHPGAHHRPAQHRRGAHQGHPRRHRGAPAHRRRPSASRTSTATSRVATS